MKHLYFASLIFLFSTVAASTTLAQSNIVRVSSIENKVVEVKIYPNPATEKFSISSNIQNLQYISINNIIGKELRRIKVNSDNTYDISDLMRGIYIVRVFNSSDELVKALRLSKT